VNVTQPDQPILLALARMRGYKKTSPATDPRKRLHCSLRGLAGWNSSSPLAVARGRNWHLSRCRLSTIS